MPTFSKSTIIFALLGLSLPAYGTRNERDVLDLQLHLRQAKSPGKCAGNVVLDGGFWFTNVTVGSGPPVELLVDTGSADLVLNPGRYKRGTGSIDLQKNFEITYGTTTGNAAGSSSQTLTAALYNDSVTYPPLPQNGLTLNPQTVGLVVSNSSNSSDIYPHDGIIGLGGQRFSGTNGTTFFHNLCERNLLDECRFGLALESSGTGTLTLGGVSDTLAGGEKSLTKVPILEEWFVAGDLAVDGNIIQKDLVVEFDSGSSSIIGPVATVSALFDKLGIQSVLQPSDSGDTLVGYFPCGKAFNVGFSFPSQSNISAAAGSGLDISNTSKVFNILQDAMSMGPVDAEGKNCSSVISGYDFAALPGLWVVGQAFFQGKYIDHSLTNGSLGLAELNSSSIVTRNASTTSPTTPAKSTAISAASHGQEMAPALFGLIVLLTALSLTA